MQRVTEERMILEFGVVTEHDGGGHNLGFIALFIPGEPPALEADEPFAVVQIGPNTYAGDPNLLERDGYYGGYILSDSEYRIALDITNNEEMTVQTANGTSVLVDLSQSDAYAGLLLAMECQEEKS
ncbi:hypothetical protein [Histidinibacterium aquaticum]|uniref:Uncharacterized protein n=1 Tax=Histidinibacterium aquaticum TaxID=2613962 RepID=A0A5J5GJ33_9RHOB|nr:hypothetical protein [Histidinibacterium aquaticum]KAA9008127.1 hypothetical protein F3S47_11540 [Histidinibacterium aquaticum]